MSFFTRVKMPWTWQDPLHGLCHVTSRCVSDRSPSRRLWYLTGCGIRLNVDDVNVKTMTRCDATCLACVVAAIPDVVSGKE